MKEISKIKAVRRGGLAIASVMLLAAFALPSSAFAESCSQANSNPTAAQYCSPAGVHGGNNNGEVKGIEGESESAAETPTETTVETAPAVEAEVVQESSSSSSLPFTGLDVGVLVVVALALAGAGLVLRRLTTPRDTRS